MARASNALSAAISSLLPTVCVLVLYVVKMIVVRIGPVILFTGLFSMAFAFFTDAKKHEIFGAVAA